MQGRRGTKIVRCEFYIGSNNATVMRSLQAQIKHYQDMGIEMSPGLLDSIGILHEIAARNNFPLDDLMLYALDTGEKKMNANNAPDQLKANEQ